MRGGGVRGAGGLRGVVRSCEGEWGEGSGEEW